MYLIYWVRWQALPSSLIWGVCVKLLQLCLTVCGPMACSPPVLSVHRILQARTLEWVAVHSSTGSSWPKSGMNPSLLHLLHYQVCSLPVEPSGKTQWYSSGHLFVASQFSSLSVEMKIIFFLFPPKMLTVEKRSTDKLYRKVFLTSIMTLFMYSNVAH